MENFNEDKNETSDKNESVDFTKLIDAFKDVLKEVDVNDLADSFNNVKLEKNKSDENKHIETLKSQDLANKLNLEFWKSRFIKEVVVIVVILGSICYLSYLEKVNEQIVGTLLGSIIGYAIGNFNASKKN